MKDGIIQLNNENFEQEVINSPLPVLIDFWAPWCGPCQIVSPIVEEIAEIYKGKIKVGKLNVDDAQEIAIRYGIRGIPTLLVFKGGEVADRMIGAYPKEMVHAFINQII
ncbi:MAG: thioredoxin [Deltaproteobacteria bacterium]|nr:MAG: thioredoxin [Deltaproteobacteria bacterium]